MTRRSWVAAPGLISAVLTLALIFLWALALPGADRSESAPAKAEKKRPGDGVFGLDKVVQIHLRFDAKEWAKMQPAGGMGFRGGPGFGRPPGSAAKGDKSADTHKSQFNFDFPWVKGELTFADRTYKDVGMRYKGNYTYMASSHGLKRPLKIDFDRNNAEQDFHGLLMLNLHNGVSDPSKAREALSYAFFRAAGVPAPRTAFAEVTLTVPGKYDKEYVGIYTLTEQVDRTFLKSQFKSGKGMLLKPEGLQGGLQHLGEDWKAYEQRYRPKKEPAAEQKKRLIEFTRLINLADDSRFEKEIASFLDVDAFLRFLAANALLANLDSFLAFGHNYFLYLRPDTNKFVFIPWDLDLSLGAWPHAGTPEQQLELSIMHPHAGQNKLIDRLLAMKDVNEKYRKVLKEMVANCFTKERLLKDLDAVEKVLKEPLAKERKAVAARREGGGGFAFGPGGGGTFGASVPPRMFFEKRTTAVAAQLEGKSRGFVPMTFGFGPPGGFPAPQRAGEILSTQQQNQLQLTQEQKKQMAELQKEIDAKIQKILTEQQRASLKRMQSARPGGPGFGPGGPGFGPGGPPKGPRP